MTTAAAPRTSYGDRVLVTIHGVWSDNIGLHRLGEHCKGALPGLTVVYVNYGSTTLKVQDEETRFTIFNTVRGQFRKLLDDLRDKRGYPQGLETKIYVVAHSFGTVALLELLRQPLRALRVERAVLLGSLLSRWTDWEHLVDEASVIAQAPLNIVRPFDLTVKRGGAMGGGLSGTRGFSPMGRYPATDHFKLGGHTAYDAADFADVVSVLDGKGTLQPVSWDSFHASLGRVRRTVLSAFRMLEWA